MGPFNSGGITASPFLDNEMTCISPTVRPGATSFWQVRPITISIGTTTKLNFSARKLHLPLLGIEY